MAQLEVNLPPINLINFNRLRFWMPDIVMCIALICPFREKCYRYKATPSGRQSYFAQEPFKMDGCDYYLPIESTQYEDRTGHRDGSIPQEDSSGSNKES